MILKRLKISLLFLVSCAISQLTFALDGESDMFGSSFVNTQSADNLPFGDLSVDSLPINNLPANNLPITNLPITNPDWSRSSFQLAQQSNQRQFRSEGEVVREVKRRYQAQVLKLSLDQQRGVYRVRILLLSGKVKSVSVSAYR